ncbi:MAG: cytochrome c553, partial [Pirellulaceae bacterium]
MNKTISQFLAIVLISLCTSIVSASNVWAVTPEEAQQQSLSSFQADVRPLLARFCFECHGDKKQQAKVRLSALDPDMADGSDGETWHDALNQLNQGDMPPEKAKQPSIEEREMIVRWMTAELKRAIAVKRSTGGQVVMRRLARYEYDNTMRDLLGVHLDFSKDLPADAISPDGL